MNLEALRRPSLVRRLVILAAGGVVAALLVSALVLSLLFQQAALRQFDRSLSQLIDNLLTGSTIGENGQVVAPALTDEQALFAFSGRYWQIAEPAGQGKLHVLVRSYSLFDEELRAPPSVVDKINAAPGKTVAYGVRGPKNEPLRALASQARLPGRTAPVIFMAAEDRSSINADVGGFIAATALAFVLLGAGMIVAVIIQVQVGLRPLFDLQEEVAAVRRGKAEKLVKDYPSELTPLSEELNALMTHNQEVVDRQRTHVGNLAHALKTPLSVMLTEAAQRPGPLAEVVSRQAEVMRDQVDHHLRRARAAARTQGQGERTSLAEVLDELSRTLERIFRDRGVTIDWDADDDLHFQGERQDLLEIAGNAMENACKWGKARVRVRAAPLTLQRLRLTIEDDGPGLPPDDREQVLRRGARLDENAPGSGLGLSIVDDLARAYGGALHLGDSPLGGLLVELELPRTDT